MSDYNREMVLAKVAHYFPNHAQEEIMKILDIYGEDSSEKGRARVQLAILKLSGGDLDQVRKNVELANGDFRDVIGWAEYPEESSARNPNDLEDIRRRRERDRQQYLDWLNGTT